PGSGRRRRRRGRGRPDLLPDRSPAAVPPSAVLLPALAAARRVARLYVRARRGEGHSALDRIGPRAVYSPLVNTVLPGTEWVVDAHGCDPGALRSRDVLAAVFAAVGADLRLPAARHAPR